MRRLFVTGTNYYCPLLHMHSSYSSCLSLKTQPGGAGKKWGLNLVNNMPLSH